MTVRAPEVSRLLALCLTAVGLAAVAAGCRASDSSTNVEEIAFASRNQQFEDCCKHQFPPGRHRNECVDEARHGRCRLDCRPPRPEHDAGAPDTAAPTCPTLTPITTTPQDAGVIPFGGTIELSVSALDPSGGLAGLSFAWSSSSGGSVSELTSSGDSVEVDGSAVFLCTAGGSVEVAATIPNGCPTTLVEFIDLTCSFCGDGILESGEQCDPPTPGICGSDCQIATVCGDGILGPGEQCDPPHQSPDGLQCGPDCKFLTCGDGVIDPGEQCDPPKSSGTAPLCSQTCQIPTCGNGVIDPGEQCDPPKSSGTAPFCSQTCQIPTCGNGVVDPGETCDPPTAGVCDSSCQSIPVVCGDGIVEPGETCEFPNAMFCQNCQLTACGGCAFALCNIGQACNTLTGADVANCIALEGCLGNLPSCQGGLPSLSGCFCAPPFNCSFTSPCSSQLEALAHTTDPATLMQLLSDRTSIYTAIGVELGCPEGAGCGPTCAGH